MGDNASTLPVGWEWSTLAETATVLTDGNWIESKDQSDDGIRLVQTGNVGIGEFKDRRDKARFISEQTFQRLKCFEVLPEDILISRLPDPVGRACIIPNTGDKMITAVDCSIVRVEADKIDPSFLVYYTESKKYLRDVDDLCTGTTRRRISRKNLAKTPIPLPPLEEQRRIVAKLDRAFEARARTLAEANLADAEALFESYLDEQLSSDRNTWPLHRMDRLGKIQTGGTPRKADADSYGDFIPFIKPGDFRPNGSLDLSNEGLSETGASKARIVPEGSALMVCIGATIGKAGYAEASITTNQQINSITPKDGVSGNFLYYQFISPAFQKEVWKRSGQATLPIINKSKWSEIEVAVPNDIGVQNAVVEKLRKIRWNTDAMMNAYTTKLTDIADLRQSLLQKAFSGQL